MLQSEETVHKRAHYYYYLVIIMYSFILLFRCSIISENSTGTCCLHYAMVLGWSACSSKEACLYVGTDWLKLIHQLEGGKRSVIQVSVDHAAP